MKKYCLLTDEGTAASETCLCETHLSEANKDYVYYVMSSDCVKSKDFIDCSMNDSVSCIVCNFK